MTKPFKPDNQGEGDRDSARRYNANVQKHAHSGKSEAAAEQAREDVDGPDGKALADAEREGKKHIAEEDPEVERRLGDEDENDRTP